MHPRPLLVVCPLIALLFFISSCNGPVPGAVDGEAAGRPSSPKPISDDRTQVAEYVVAAFEDSKGDLWFGTNGQGAARYDGTSLRYYSAGDGLIGDVVTGLAEDRAGGLWFGTHTGASRFDGKTFTGYGAAEGLTGSGCKLLVDRHGTVWAGTSDGVFRYEGRRFVAFPLPIPVIDTPSYKIVAGKIWDLFEDSKGNLWFARDGYGACKYDPSAVPAGRSGPPPDGGGAFTHFTKQDGLCSNNVAAIAEDARGDMWFGSITSDFPRYINEGGLSRYDGKTFTRFSELKGLGASDVYFVAVDRAGMVWAGAIRVGAYRFDGGSFTLFDQTDGPVLPVPFGIQSFVQDRHGTRWFGFSGGLYRFQGTSFVNVTRSGPWSSP